MALIRVFTGAEARAEPPPCAAAAGASMPGQPAPAPATRHQPLPVRRNQSELQPNRTDSILVRDQTYLPSWRCGPGASRLSTAARRAPCAGTSTRLPEGWTFPPQVCVERYRRTGRGNVGPEPPALDRVLVLPGSVPVRSWYQPWYRSGPGADHLLIQIYNSNVILLLFSSKGVFM